MCTAALLLFLCVPAFADAPSIEERLAKLESLVHDLQVENQQLREKLGMLPPAPAPPARVSTPQADVKAGGSERQLQIGGMLQAQAEAGDALDSRYADNNSRIYLRRARLNASGKFAEQFDFKTEIDMTGTVGGSSGLRAQLTDAYVAWVPSKQFNVRAGQYKTPFGFEQLYSDSRLFVPERTLGSDRLALSRQLGVSVLGTLADRFTYAVGAFNGTGTNTSANDNDQFLYAGRATASLWEGSIASAPAHINLGVNGFRSHDSAITLPADFGFKSNSFAGERRGLGVDAQATVGPVEIWTEWLRDRFEPQSHSPFASFNADAKSVLAAYSLRAEKLQLVARYDTFDPDTRLSGLSTKTWDAGANYLIRGHDLKLQLHFVHAKSGDATRDRVIARLQTVF